MQKDVSTLQITMENIYVVQRFKALDELNEDAPDVFFAQVGLFLLMARNLLEKITVVCILHNDATAQNEHNFLSRLMVELTRARSTSHQ